MTDPKINFKRGHLTFGYFKQQYICKGKFVCEPNSA